MRFRSCPQNSRPEELFGERQRVIKFSKNSGVLLFIYCCDPKLFLKPLQLYVDFFFEASHRTNAVLHDFRGLQISFWNWWYITLLLMSQKCIFIFKTRNNEENYKVWATLLEISLFRSFHPCYLKFSVLTEREKKIKTLTTFYKLKRLKHRRLSKRKLLRYPPPPAPSNGEILSVSMCKSCQSFNFFFSFSKDTEF